jgi:hypothetical protein
MSDSVVLSLQSMLREVGCLLRIRLPNNLGSQLEQIANRGVQTLEKIRSDELFVRQG